MEDCGNILLNEGIPEIYESAKYIGPFGKIIEAISPICRNVMYGITIGYIGMDLLLKYRNNKDNPDIQKYMGYQAVWHSQASILFPMSLMYGLTSINRKIVNKFIPIGITMMSVPFIIKPINGLADFITRNTYCRAINWTPNYFDEKNKCYCGYDCTKGKSWSSSC